MTDAEYDAGYALGLQSGQLGAFIHNSLDPPDELSDPDADLALTVLQNAREWLRESGPELRQLPDLRLSRFTTGFINGVHDSSLATARDDEALEEMSDAEAWNQAAQAAGVALADLALWVASNEAGAEAFER